MLRLVIKTKPAEGARRDRGNVTFGFIVNGDCLEAVIYSAVSRKPLKMKSTFLGQRNHKDENI